MRKLSLGALAFALCAFAQDPHQLHIDDSGKVLPQHQQHHAKKGDKISWTRDSGANKSWYVKFTGGSPCTEGKRFGSGRGGACTVKAVCKPSPSDPGRPSANRDLPKRHGPESAPLNDPETYHRPVGNRSTTHPAPRGIDMVGRTVSHFEILEKLGEGGMGVVYCARDLKLDRLVAVKILPAQHTSDPRRRARFAAEAKAASALNHPNIITIYEIETVDGVDYIAMEYVRGVTLHEVIQGPRTDLATILDYAAQIASALAAAHAAGIVHRDIKPGNIMITKSNAAKLLDCWMQQLKIEQPDVNPEADTATMAFLTNPGTVVGTVAYMSPEQAQGGGVGARSDIFSFGVVLYQKNC